MSTVVPPPARERLEPLMGPLNVATAPALGKTIAVPVEPRFTGALMVSEPPVTRRAWPPRVRVLVGRPPTVRPLPLIISELTVTPPVGTVSLVVSLTLVVEVAP